MRHARSRYAERVVSDAGSDGERGGRARTFPLGATKASVAIAVLGIAASGAAFEDTRSSVFVVASAVLVCLLGSALRRSRAIVVGVDGVRIEGWFGARFLAFADLLDVKARPRLEGITLHTKRARRIAVGTTFAGPGVEGEIAQAVREALERWRAASIARDRQRADGGRAMSLSLPAPSAPGAVHYRVASVPRARLLDVIEDPAEELHVRVAAAAALEHDPDDADSAERLARVRDATASVELRRALDPRGHA
jgi:hypothetical protein